MLVRHCQSAFACSKHGKSPCQRSGLLIHETDAVARAAAHWLTYVNRRALNCGEVGTWEPHHAAGHPCHTVNPFYITQPHPAPLCSLLSLSPLPYCPLCRTERSTSSPSTPSAPSRYVSPIPTPILRRRHPPHHNKLPRRCNLFSQHDAAHP
jgi:hypothetical protein